MYEDRRIDLVGNTTGVGMSRQDVIGYRAVLDMIADMIGEGRPGLTGINPSAGKSL
jgi:hypothetical protein